MKRQQWIMEALRLHFDDKLSFRAAGKRLGINESTIHRFFTRFATSELTWPLPADFSTSKLERRLYPGSPAKHRHQDIASSLVNPPMVAPHQKRQRTHYSVEFKRALVQRSVQPNMNVAQLARENGINHNLLFNWRRQYLSELNKSRPDAPVTLLPVEIAETRSAIVDVTPLQPTLTEPGNALCCEVVLPEGTVKLSGAVTPTLLRMLLDELKGERR